MTDMPAAAHPAVITPHTWPAFADPAAAERWADDDTRRSFACAPCGKVHLAAADTLACCGSPHVIPVVNVDGRWVPALTVPGADVQLPADPGLPAPAAADAASCDDGPLYLRDPGQGRRELRSFLFAAALSAAVITITVTGPLWAIIAALVSGALAGLPAARILARRGGARWLVTTWEGALTIGSAAALAVLLVISVGAP